MTLSLRISSFSPKNARNSSFVGVAIGNCLKISVTNSSEMSVTYLRIDVLKSSFNFFWSLGFLVMFQIEAKESDLSFTLYLISFISASNPDLGLIEAYPGITSAMLSKSKFWSYAFLRYDYNVNIISLHTIDPDLATSRASNASLTSSGVKSKIFVIFFIKSSNDIDEW